MKNLVITWFYLQRDFLCLRFILTLIYPLFESESYEASVTLTVVTLSSERGTGKGRLVIPVTSSFPPDFYNT